MEEVAGQHGGGLRGKKPPPAGVVATHRSGWNTEPFEDPADRGRTQPVPETAQFTLHASVAPARIVPGHLLNQGDDGRIDRRPSRPAREGPVPGDQPPMPGKD